jgi:hypothetical protein
VETGKADPRVKTPKQFLLILVHELKLVAIVLTSYSLHKHEENLSPLIELMKQMNHPTSNQPNPLNL